MTHPFSNRSSARSFAAAAVIAVIPVVCLGGVPQGTSIRHSGILTGHPNGARIGNQGVAGNPGIAPPASKADGLSYGEWSAAWWQWLLSIPAAVNPNLNTDAAVCGEGQAGHVWFLPGSFGTMPATRTCTIPPGKSLLLPLPNVIFGAGVGDCLSPGWGDAGPCDVGALRDAAAGTVDTVDMAIFKVTIDNVPVQNLAAYRFQSPEFAYTLPQNDNLLSALFSASVPGGTYYPAVSDGFWLMINPLTPGSHTIHIKSVYLGSFGEGDLNLIIQQ